MPNEKLERITVVYLAGPNASTAFKVGEGPKYITYVHRKENVGNKYNTFQVEKASDKHLVLRGHHPRLGDKLREAHEQHQRDYREHWNARERAIWEFRDAWDAQHSPPRVDIPAIIAPYKSHYGRKG